MCTVIYMPTKAGPLFSSCRDENPARSAAVEPQIVKGDSGLVVYPKDTAAQGTWIGLHEQGHSIILLNGAFINHVKKIVYKYSRGLIVTALLDSRNPLEKWETMELDNIEPFTLVVWRFEQLFELAWDGKRKFKKEMQTEVSYVWSSCTLYEPAAQELRRHWFEKALEVKDIENTDDLLQILKAHNDLDNGFIMKRNDNIQTLSISLIEHRANHTVFHYHDLHKKTVSKVWLKKQQSLQIG